MIHLYCVVDDPDAALEVCREAALEGMVVISAGRLACVGRAGDLPLPADSPQALLDHDAVNRRLMRVCTVLPFRFGTVLPGEEEVHEQMALRLEDFELMMPGLRGKVELALRASTAPPPHRCSGSGRGYLRTLQHQAGRSVLHELHRTLCASSSAAVLTADRPCSMKSSYLVDGRGVDGFCRLLAQTLSGLDGAQGVSLTGPWAPYSFVTDAVAIPVQPGSARGARDA